MLCCLLDPDLFEEIDERLVVDIGNNRRNDELRSRFTSPTESTNMAEIQVISVIIIIIIIIIRMV